MAAYEDAPGLPAHTDASAAALGSVVIALSGTLAAASGPELCELARLLLESTGATMLTCDVAALGRPDAGTLDALARVALVARRLGRAVELRDPCPRLQALIILAGLDDALPYALTPTPPASPPLDPPPSDA